MAWNSTNLLGPRIEDVYTTMEYALGTRCMARNTTSGYAGEFIFAKGVASTVATSWVLISYDDHSTSLLADGDIGPVGIAMAATVANTYGWYQIRGKASGKLAASVNDNAGLYTTATAGTAGATSAGKSEIIGARAAAASGAGGATEVEINYPVCGLSAG
jgi:hypothetical protein